MDLDENLKEAEAYLIKFDAEIAATSLDYIELKLLLDEFFRHSNLLSQFNFHSVYQIGLYNFNAIQKDDPHSEI